MPVDHGNRALYTFIRKHESFYIVTWIWVMRNFCTVNNIPLMACIFEVKILRRYLPINIFFYNKMWWRQGRMCLRNEIKFASNYYNVCYLHWSCKNILNTFIYLCILQCYVSRLLLLRFLRLKNYHYLLPLRCRLKNR